MIRSTRAAIADLFDSKAAALEETSNERIQELLSYGASLEEATKPSELYIALATLNRNLADLIRP